MWIALKWKVKCQAPPEECPRRCLQTPQVWLDDQTPVRGCPPASVAPWALTMLNEYPRYEDGMYIEPADDGGPGAPAIQPYFYLWAMGVIGSEIASIRQKEAEEEERKREREARSRRW